MSTLSPVIHTKYICMHRFFVHIYICAYMDKIKVNFIINFSVLSVLLFSALVSAFSVSAENFNFSASLKMYILQSHTLQPSSAIGTLLKYDMTG